MSEDVAEHTPNAVELLDALRVLEGRCLMHAAGLPQPEAPQDVWAGVLFRVGPAAFLAPIEEIGEMLEAPRDITPVPCAKPWVCGMSNNRGILLPIFDLRAYLFGAPSARNARNRVLVVRHDEFPFGLLVADVVGIRHFEASAREPTAPNQGAGIDDLLDGSFRLGVDCFPVFSVRRLGVDAKFNLAAA